MTEVGKAAEKEQTAPHPEDPRKPDELSEISKPAWKLTLKNTWAEFSADKCTDLAAMLTYYSVLSIFPALLALVSLVGVFGHGDETVTAMLDIVRQLGQSDTADTLEGPVTEMVNANRAGITLVVGILTALWSASAYVGGFGRAMNTIYEVDEGRPVWKLRPMMLLVTTVLVVGAALVLLGLVISGPVAEAVGGTIGLGSQSVTIWNWVKLPVILGIVVLMVALLYYATPNVKQPKFRWMSIGAAVAIVVWVIASIAFAFYVSRFGNYNKTYGSLATVVITLLWLWLTNLALLFGAELDAELERSRQLQAGLKAERTLQLPPRDTRQSEKAEEKLEKRVAEGRELRKQAIQDGPTGAPPEGKGGHDRSRHEEADRTRHDGRRSDGTRTDHGKAHGSKESADDDSGKAPKALTLGAVAGVAAIVIKRALRGGR